MKKFYLLFLASVVWLTAADPAGFAQWKSAELKSYDEKLAGKVDAQKFASQRSPGDIVHIAANTPHQLMIPDGRRFTYAVVKVDSQ